MTAAPAYNPGVVARPAAPGRRAEAKHLGPWLLLVLALCVVRLWIMPLWSSFWVDEMATVFVARHGTADASLRIAPQVPDSIYYWLPRLAASLGTGSEVAYRLFSVLAMATALFLIGRLAARLVHPQAGWFVVFGCLALRGFDYEAADARPYALGTCIAAAAVFLLVRWLDSGRIRDGLAFAAAASLLWRVQLIYWPFYTVFAAYALVRGLRGKTRAGWRQTGAIFGLLVVSLLPVALRALALYREAAAHVIVPAPTLADLGASLKLAYVTGACTGAFLLSRWRGWGSGNSARVSRGSTTLILSWWLAPPLGLFLFSVATGNSVFVSRYLSLALPGVALAAAAVAAPFIPRAWWKNVSLGLGLGVLLSLGQWNHVWPAHHRSDWREAAQALRDWVGSAGVPVICPSPFVEARPPAWHPDYPLPGFLYAHLSVYRISGKPYLFPFESSPEAEQFARRLTAETLSPAGRFAIYGGDHAVRFWRDWLSARPELAGWHIRQLGNFGDVEVTVFEKPPLPDSRPAANGRPQLAMAAALYGENR
jgi:hypothetical protein